MQRITNLAKRAAPLLKLASEYTAAHIIARLMAATSGLILVRLLSVSEYGFYTLVLSAFTFICTFSDLGATETLSFFRWRARKRNLPWLHYFHAVVRFRKTVFMFGFLAAASYVFATGHKINTQWGSLLPGIMLMGVGAWFAIQAGINTYVLKLEQRFRLAYAVELGNEGTKLLGAVLIWLLGLTTAVAGMASVALGSLVAVLLSLKLLDHAGLRHVAVTQRRSSKNLRMLLSQILPILPGTIHFALQGPLVALLAAYFGSVANVAEVGALGRIGALVGVVAGFTGSVFVPKLATITDEAVFFKRYMQWWGVILLMGGFIMLTVFLFPDALLFLLGTAYSGLHAELLIMVATSVVGVWSAFTWHVNRARGWIKYQPYRVPVILAGQVAMLIMLDFATTKGVLLFGLGSLILDVLFQTAINALGFSARVNARHKAEA